LKLLISDCEKELCNAEKKTVDTKTLYQGLMEFTEIKELTPTIVNKPIKRIEVRKPEKKHSHNCVKIDITFTAIGLFQKSDEAEIQKLMQGVKENPSEYKQISA
jgi:site-specific recombinases, DNA invertase pin homologs